MSKGISSNIILLNKVLKVQTRLTRRIKNSLNKLDSARLAQLNRYGKLSTERATTFLAAALGDGRARTVSEMEKRLKLSPTNGTSYRAIRMGKLAGVVVNVGNNKYKLNI